MKKLLFIICVVLSPILTLAEDTVLVAITVYDGRDSNEYYGELSLDSYESVTTELKEYAMIQLNNVFWINSEGKIQRMSQTHRNGHKYGYTNTMFVRQEYVSRVVPLDKKYLDSVDKK